MTVEVGAILAAAGILCGIVFGFAGWKRQSKKDSYSEGGQHGAMQADIQYIKRRTDDTLFEVKETNRSVNALSERMTRCEESTKSAHKRIDTIEERK